MTLFYKNLIIFLIPLILLAVILVYFLSNEITNRVLQNYQRQFDTVCSTLNNNFRNIHNFSNQLSNSSWMQELFLQEHGVFQNRQEDIYELNTYNKNLSAYKTSNSFINHIAVYFINRDLILSTKGVINRGDIYPLKPTNISKNTWEKKLAQVKRGRILSTTEIDVVGNTDEGILFIQAIPYFGTNPRAVVIVFVQKRVLESLIQENITLESGMQLEIADINNLILYDNYSSEELNDSGSLVNQIQEVDEEMDGNNQYIKLESDYIFVKTSYVDGLSYYLKIPEENIRSTKISHYTIPLIITLTSILLIILIGGIILSRYVSRIEYRPVAELIQKVEDIEKTSLKLLQTNQTCDEGNEYQKINTALYNVMNIFSDISKRLEDSKNEHQKIKLLQYLSSNDYPDKEQVINALPCGHFCCIAFRTKKRIELNDDLQELFRPLADEKSIKITTLEYKGDHVMIIHNISDETYNTYISQLKSTLQSLYKNKMIIGCSCMEANNNMLKRTFFQALKALEYTFIKENENVIPYSHIYDMEKKQYYIYNIESEMQLVESLRTGNGNKAKSIVQEVINKNLIEHQVSIDAIRYLLTHFLNLAYIIANEMKVYDDIIAKLNNKTKKEVISEELEDLYRSYDTICETICLRRSDDYLEQTIIEYIEKNYDNPDLSLSIVASDFGYSVPYFSKLFKSVMKKGLTKYIHNYRIESAKCLLVSSNLSIKEISKEVGYSSDITFRRVFKAQEKIPASEYRNLFQENKTTDNSSNVTNLN